MVNPDLQELYKQRAVSRASRLEEGITAGDRAFVYVCALLGFCMVLWMKREAMSDTRRRVTTHLRQLDRPVTEDSWVQIFS